MNLNTFLFCVLAVQIGVCAVGVVVTQNIVRAAAWLLFTLAGTAGIFFLLGAEFVGATQLLVYVGGTLVLVVFGVMLTAQGPFINMRVNAAEWAIAAAVGLLLYGTLAISLYKMPPPVSPGELSALSKSPLLGESFLGFTEPVRPAEITGVPENVHIRRTKMAYLLPFEIVSVHLLVVLVGAAYLARAKRRRGASS